MSKLHEYFRESIDSQSPGMPVRIISGLLVIVFAFIWVPLGLIGLLGLLWVVYVTRYPEAMDYPKVDPEDILAPMDGLVTSVDTTSTQKRIRISQQFQTNKLILMPCHGKIDINIFIDGLFLPTKISNASSLNARREICINQDKSSSSSNTDFDVSLILWGSPFARYLGSPVLEGRKLRAGVPIAVLLLYGEIDILLPSHCNLQVTLGDFCIAGKTLLTKLN